MVQQYRANVTILYQQEGSRLRRGVRERSVVGETDFWDRIGPTDAVQKTVRHAATPLISTPHSRRKVDLLDFEWADLVDPVDKLRTIHTMESEYAQNGAKALGRSLDSELILAFTRDAKAGKTGSTTVTFASEAAGDLSFVAAAITTANLLTVKLRLDNKVVPMGTRYVAIVPHVLEQLLKQSTSPNASSFDYNSVKALVNGDVNTWAGFEWIMMDPALMPVGTDATRKFNFAWHRDAMGLSMAQEISTDIGVRRDLSNAMQVYLLHSFGATRIMGEGVVRFETDQDM